MSGSRRAGPRSRTANALDAPAGLSDEEDRDALATEHGFGLDTQAAFPEPTQALASPQKMPEPWTSNPPDVGDTLHGYVIEAVVGEGAHARVFAARHQYLSDQRVAIKVLKDEVPASARSRMIREANVLARLRHEKIVSLIDFGLTSHGLPFIVMELLEGRTLFALDKLEGPLAFPRVLSLSLDIAEALGAAHAAGYVHRDLKLGNVMVMNVRGRETAKLLDFGIVTFVDADAAATRLTATNQFVGTPAYMAPEQLIRGETVGPKADLYSLGVLMYRLLRGETPFTGGFHEIVHQHLHDVPAPIPAAGPAEALILRLLSKHPSARPASADEVAHELRRLLGQPIASEAGPSTPKASSKPLIAISVATALLAFAMGRRTATPPPVQRDPAPILESFGIDPSQIPGPLSSSVAKFQQNADVTPEELRRNIQSVLTSELVRARVVALEKRVVTELEEGTRRSLLLLWTGEMQAAIDQKKPIDLQRLSLTLRAIELELRAK